MIDTLFDILFDILFFIVTFASSDISYIAASKIQPPYQSDLFNKLESEIKGIYLKYNINNKPNITIPLSKLKKLEDKIYQVQNYNRITFEENKKKLQRISILTSFATLAILYFGIYRKKQKIYDYKEFTKLFVKKLFLVIFIYTAIAKSELIFR